MFTCKAKKLFQKWCETRQQNLQKETPFQFYVAIIQAVLNSSIPLNNIELPVTKKIQEEMKTSPDHHTYFFHFFSKIFGGLLQKYYDDNVSNKIIENIQSCAQLFLKEKFPKQQEILDQIKTYIESFRNFEREIQLRLVNNEKKQEEVRWSEFISSMMGKLNESVFLIVYFDTNTDKKKSKKSRISSKNSNYLAFV